MRNRTQYHFAVAALALFLVGAGLLLSVVSCSKRPVLPGGMKVSVDFDNIYIETGKEPELFRFALYGKNGGEEVLSDYLSPRGGEVYVPFGEYDYIAHNFDLESSQAGKTSAFATSVVGSYPASDDEASLYRHMTEGRGDEVHYTPDALYAAVGSLTVATAAAASDSRQVLSARLKVLTRRLKLQVVGIKGLDNVSSVRVYFDGFASTMNLSEGRPCGTPCCYYMDCGRDRVTGGVTGVLTHYGLSQETDRSMAYIVITDIAGNAFWSAADIRGELLRQASATEGLVRIEYDITIDRPQGEEDGFMPTLEDWIDVSVPVPIG